MRVVSVAGALALTASAAGAGGVDRSGQSVAILFEQGNYAEFSLGSLNPSVSGVGAGTTPTIVTPTPGADSGDMADSYLQIGGAVKMKLGESLDAALIVDQPYGANVDYPTGTGYFAAGSTAELNSTAITGILKYRLPSNVSVYGGLRYQTVEAEAFIPFVSPTPGVTPPYQAQGDNDGGVGYLVGVAYERPEIALRVALTYNSKISHSIDTSETSALGSSTSVTEVDTPQSVNLEFQSGVAADTLVFGSIRWVEWSAFDISPAAYATLTGGGSLVSFDDDTITYSLGVGRRFSDAWAGAVSVQYENQVGGFASNLGPTDGRLGVTIGGTYTRDNLKISGGVSYSDIGDAQTTLGGGATAANFNDNKAVAVGIKIGYSF